MPAWGKRKQDSKASDHSIRRTIPWKYKRGIKGCYSGGCIETSELVYGKKITIDSATLVNKGLEVIEARWLFDVMPEDIEVVVQPQSIIHSMVEFEDGAIKAQLGTADMRLPIQYALYYPERRYLAGDRLDFSKIAGIITSKPDRETFKGLDFAYQAIKTGGSMPTVLNAANECAVAKFLHKDINFTNL